MALVCAFAALLLGIATIFGFAPFGASWLPVLTLAALFALWRRAAAPRAAALSGFAFGVGLFGGGVSWVYIALSSFGEMPPLLAALATLCFCAYLSLFPALAGWCCARLAPPDSGLRLALAAPLWTLTEWLRSWLLSGFPWLSLGYSQQNASLAGYAPIGGVFLVSLAITVAAVLLAGATLAVEARRWSAALICAVALLAIPALGYVLSTVEWSRPAGEPIAVSLVQGNIEQDVKFDPAYRNNSLLTYAELVEQAHGRLIVLPESALPMFADEVPGEYVERLRRDASQRGGDLLIGLFFFEPRATGADEDRYFNSVVSVGSATTQVYRKHHLVPFGETIPAKPIFGWLIRSILHIPLADQTPGPAYQEPFAVSGERLAVNICYEDAFGSDINRALPEATLLVNVTNDAWYGRSLAAEQHEQIAAMRAIEAGRPMLRATNTGITSIIDHHGREIARLPWFTRGVLEGNVAGRAGVTPYVRFGDVVAVLTALLVAIAVVLLARQGS